MRVAVRPRGKFSTPALTAVGWLAGIVMTAVVLQTPYLLFGYFSPSLHLVLNSVDACIALLLAFLLHGRFVRSRRLQDLLLAEGLLLLAVAGLGLTLLLDLFDGFRPGTLDVWLPLTLRVTGAVLIVAAALVGGRPADRLRRPWAWTGPTLAVGAAVTLWLLRDHLPLALDQSPPTSAQRSVITGHTLLVALQALAAVCFFIASAAFTRQAVRRHDELLRWLGPACALGGFARVNYVLFPSLYTDWLYTGDLLRTASYLLLLVGASREIGQYWSAYSRAAVLEDRRRLARELHDGVMQELTYIRAEAKDLTGDEQATERIVGACDRALDEARAAVDALGRASDEPLGFLLHRGAQQVAERYGGHVVVHLDDAVDVRHSQRHALVRITLEAVSNAIRHGHAENVRIRLTRDGQQHRLVVQDDGVGFDPAATAGTGYGLTSMRERAQALPGTFDVESAPGRGTAVTVTW